MKNRKLSKLNIIYLQCTTGVYIVREMPEIPTYPNFTKLTISQKDAFKKFSTWAAECSDFSFANLLVWDTSNSALISVLNSNLVIKIPEYNNSANYLTLIIGNSCLVETITTLFETNFTNKIDLLPLHDKSNKTNVEKAFSVIEDRDSFDYLYDVKSFASLEGPRYRNFRRGLSNFESKNNHSSYIYIHDATPDTRTLDEIRRISDVWAENHAGSENYEEREAIEKALELMDELPLNLSVVKDHDSVIAFILYEDIETKSQSIIHFEKALKSYHSLSYFLKYNFVKSLYSHGIDTLNYEQDLGIEGLRETKLKLNPSGFNKVFTIIPK